LGTKFKGKTFEKEESKHNYKHENEETEVYDSCIIEGRNSVMELLKSGRDINKILVSNGEMHGSINKVISLAKEKKIVVQNVDKAKLDLISQTGAHQGIIAYASAYKYFEVDEILAYAKEKNEVPFLVILDEIEDPHNLGAIIRTANCAGAHGIIISKRRAVGLTATVAKASAGAVEHTKVARVTNISQTIASLKENGLWVAGCDMTGKQNYFESDLSGAIAIVVGNEGRGISKLVSEKCDFTIKIPMLGRISSLNASVAASILMYEVTKQRLLQK
jgi:23S rRNA (guanosine2251-2'-O)-methyltransferase